ncbi:gamma-soluble NSF attachment protein [Chrysoperla carnea]|uniref:gamma-soluble NSF attachment protein n=1 Tax=Chrysoperla carnea TaxID=189513 RepID=UPI001D063B1E|nr:gamma-soluble NSF attachment protein [Chrysoperla carnea]
MNKNKFLDDALEHVRQAEKGMKTSLLKWRPDYEVAADEYSKAATCYRNAKSFEQSKDCLMKAAECHKQNRSLFHAARSVEQAILVCKELGDMREVQHLADRACNMYQTHGSPDAGASVLEKAAKILEANYPEIALQLYQRAADVVLLEDSSSQATEYINKIGRLMVRLQMYDQAADALRREIGLQQQLERYNATGRLIVALVLVQLARGDVVAAEKAFKEWGNCCEAPEVQTLESLLQAYDDEDAEAAQHALNSPFIKHMDIEYAKLARTLPLPQGEIAIPKTTSVRENAAPSYVSPHSVTSATIESDGGAIASGSSGDNAQQPASDNEDEEGGLC